jgi:hypothetical protein
MQQPNMGHDRLIFEVFQSRTVTHSWYYYSGCMIGLLQRPLTWQHTTQERGIHAHSGIQTRDPSKQEAADTGLRPHSHWDQLHPSIGLENCTAALIKYILPGKGTKFWKYLKSNVTCHPCMNCFHTCDASQNEIWQDIIKLHYLVFKWILTTSQNAVVISYHTLTINFLKAKILVSFINLNLHL